METRRVPAVVVVVVVAGVIAVVGGGVKKKREAPRRYVENLRFPFDHSTTSTRLGSVWGSRYEWDWDWDGWL